MVSVRSAEGCGATEAMVQAERGATEVCGREREEVQQ